jgi:ribosome maturation factor RimP
MRGDSRHASSRPGRAGGRASGAPGPYRERPGTPPAEPADLARLLEPVIRAAGMDLETVRVSPAGRRRLLRLVVDADGGVDLDQITEISREVSARLDASGAMGEAPYTLEVSSPGVDRPLTEPRHWRRACGRLVTAPLTVASGTASSSITVPPQPVSTVEGRVLAAGATGVTLEVDGVLREFGYAELGPGRVQVEFGRATQGLTGDDGHAARGARPGNGGSQDGH